MIRKVTIILITLVFIPILVISTFYKMLLEYENNSEIISDITNKENDLDIKIKVNKNNKIEEILLEDYIIGVVAGEMPASFDIEALKAQAIASRTYAMYKITNTEKKYDVETNTDDQVYLSINEMKDKWGIDFEKYYNKIKEAVVSTKNKIMTKENKLFKSYYFSMSNGYTEDSITVFGDNVSSSVESPWDNEQLNKFEVTTTFTLDELQNKLSIDKINSIQIIDIDKTNRVKKIKVNNTFYSGIEFRKLLHLRSTDFTIEKKDNIYMITTKGYGHGVGMSQYGANGMAKDNYNYIDILKYYYQNIEITTL